jgi:hypothetical protein
VSDRATTIDTARIAEKIRRLLALSTSSNEHEAAAAAAKAAELLHRYNLSMAEIQTPADRADFVREMIDLGNAAGWRGVLLGGIANVNGAYVVSHGGGRYGIVGQPHTIEIVRYLYEYLAGAIDRLADREWARFTGWASSPRRWKTSFRFGAIDTILSRLEAQKRAHAAESEQSRALIVVTDRALQTAIKQHYPRLSAGRRIRIGASGYEAGRSAGHGIAINPAVSGGGSSTRYLR